jgi:hypothetical protein
MPSVKSYHVGDRVFEAQEGGSQSPRVPWSRAAVFGNVRMIVGFAVWRSYQVWMSGRDWRSESPHCCRPQAVS